MLQSIRRLYGKTLGASDGEIGQIKDFYFSDEQWAVRYVVVDTGSWLLGRQVLISPHGFRNLHQKGDTLQVALSRQQIENSPPILSHKPVSRQYEEEYYRYYGWPSYWDGGGMWGVGGLPFNPWPHLMPDPQGTPGAPLAQGNDPHLRSTQAMKGYHIQTSDGSIGHLTDFVMDDESWAILHLVVKAGHWYSGNEIMLSTQDIDHISYEESTVYATKTKEAILKVPEPHVLPIGMI